VTPITPPFPAALSIAGSDPSGGAGIQADLKTFHRFGVFGETAITLLTVQNTVTVQRVDLMPVDLVLAQIDAVVQDIPPMAAKTGALGSAEMIEAIGQAAAGWRFPLVVDPVMISKHGARLASEDATEAFRRFLIPRASVVMPNLPEAEALCGFPVSTLAGMERAARALLDLGATSVVIKGGHMTGEPIDLYLDCDGSTTLPAQRIDTRNTHGTGCTYSAAVTANLALGHNRLDAVRRAKAFVTEAIRTNPGLGQGCGPLNHWAL
jgi:hydroxymethylpyrimidine/phosphomethylpyrimidine kinase